MGSEETLNLSISQDMLSFMLDREVRALPPATVSDMVKWVKRNAAEEEENEGGQLCLHCADCVITLTKGEDDDGH